MPIPEKTLERIKPYLIALFLVFIVVVGIMGQSTGDYGGGSTQPSPGYKFVGAGSTTVGVTGNVVTVSSTGGGASGAAALTNAPNFFTSASTPNIFSGVTTNNGPSVFNDITSFNAVSNNFGVASVSTNYHTGSQQFLQGGIFKNGNLAITANFTTNSGEGMILRDNNGLFAFRWASNSRQIFDENAVQVMNFTSIGGVGRCLYDNLPGVSVDFGNRTLNTQNNIDFSWSDTLMTYGLNASSSHTFNGSTFTLAHPATFNTDVLKIGPAGSTLTNGTSFVTLGTLNGISPATIHTNLASSSDGVVSWTGQGTRTMTPALNYGVVVTNGMTANMGNATNYSGSNLKFTTTYTTGLVYTVASSDYLVACISTGQSVRVMLPTSGSTGRRIGVIKTDESGFSVIVDAGASKNINGFTNFLLNVKYQPVEFIDTGTEWFAK